jgi:hypothetical protein
MGLAEFFILLSFFLVELILRKVSIRHLVRNVLVLFLLQPNEIFQSPIKIFVDVFGKAGIRLIVVTIKDVKNSFKVALVYASFGCLDFERFSFFFWFLCQFGDRIDAILFKNSLDQLLLFFY